MTAPAEEVLDCHYPLIHQSHTTRCEGVVDLPGHLAAAVETKPGMPLNRPCVAIAGGREPPHWTA